MDEFAARILQALVGGYQAREGLKDRNRALTEYEIARRAGFTQFSYVEFSTTAEREQVRAALDELERGGWATQWQHAGRYDSFVPTELGVSRASTQELVRAGVAAAQSAVQAATSVAVTPAPPSAPGAAPTLEPVAALARLVQQLDEVLALLRAIDAKLERDR
jgi:hypothetical protein